MKRFKSCRAYGAFEYLIIAALIFLSALIVFNNVKGKGENTLLDKAENSSKAFIDGSISELGVNIEVPSVPGEVIDTEEIEKEEKYLTISDIFPKLPEDLLSYQVIVYRPDMDTYFLVSSNSPMHLGEHLLGANFATKYWVLRTNGILLNYSYKYGDEFKWGNRGISSDSRIYYADLRTHTVWANTNIYLDNLLNREYFQANDLKY